MPEEFGTISANIQDPTSGNGLSILAGGAAKIDGSAVTQPVSGTVATTQSGVWTNRLADTTGSGITSTSVNGRQAVDTRRADVSLLAVTATGVAGAAVTLTLPAAASVFHYIQSIEIVKYATAAITGTATPVVVTTTNLPGGLAFTFGTAQAIGTTLDYTFVGIDTLRSSAVNTATTIVCPATTSVIWRVNVLYYTTG